MGRNAARISAEQKKRRQRHFRLCRLVRSEFQEKIVLRCYSSSPSKPSTGVMVPKRPWCSSSIPAEKNRVFAGPASPSLPNVSDHSPLMARTESSGFFTKPMNLCVKPLNAAILPLPKLPMRIALLNSPKSRVVQTAPQGELSHGPCSRWPMCLPEGVKIRTKPLPSPATSSCLAHSAWRR